MHNMIRSKINKRLEGGGVKESKSLITRLLAPFTLLCIYWTAEKIIVCILHSYFKRKNKRKGKTPVQSQRVL